MSTGALTSTGWVDWQHLTTLLGSDPCLWTDLGGLHYLTTVPPALPVGATHLWAWRPGRWTRVRIDGDRALATFLTPDGPGLAVAYTTTSGITWGADLRAAECHLEVTLAATEGPAAITFVTSCAPT